MSLALGILLFFAFRTGKGNVVLPIISVATWSGLLMFVLGELAVRSIFNVTRISPKKPGDYPRFAQLADTIRKERRFLWCPRLYVMDMDVPNAMAFGWGFLGQAGIAITPSLYELLDDEELKAVLAHEFGHVVCRDAGLMALIVAISGGSEELSRIFLKGKTFFGTGPVALIIGAMAWLFAKIVIPIGRSALAQEREYSADALAALWLNDWRPLASALKKLSANASGKSSARKRMFSDLFISHPEMSKRLAALQQLEQQKGSHAFDNTTVS